MPIEVLLPKWGMGMNDGMIVKWLKNEGDHVEEGEHLVEIESAKVNSEVESPGAGTLARIVAPEGAVIVPGTVIAVILAAGEAATDLPARMAVGDGPATGTVASQPAGVQPAATAPPPATAQPSAAAPRPGGGSAAQAGPRQVTPVARRLAQQFAVNLDAVTGTGPGGRVTEEDVRRASASGSAGGAAAAATGVPSASSEPAAVPAPLAPAAPASATSAPAPGGVAVRSSVQLRGMRATIARRMTESAAIPTVTLTHEADITAAVASIEGLVRDWRQHRVRPQFQDLVLKATARALAEHPRANAWLLADPERPGQFEVRELAEVNLGFAVAVPEGLIVPVIHRADQRTLLEVAQSVRDITGRIKNNSMKVEDLEGGTFSVTNLGAYGIDAFNPLLNPPQVGILGLGRVVEKPAVHEGKVVTRSFMWLSLNFDHRAWDGAPAGDFLRTVVKYLGDPAWMLG